MSFRKHINGVKRRHLLLLIYLAAIRDETDNRHTAAGCWLFMTARQYIRTVDAHKPFPVSAQRERFPPGHPPEKQKPPKTEEALDCFQQGLPCKKRHRPTLPPVTAIPSALAGLTALFGMGRGRHRRYRHLKIFYGMRQLDDGIQAPPAGKIPIRQHAPY